MPRRQITEREETPTGTPREGYEDFEECQCDDCQEQKERRLASDDWWEEASHRMVEERLENRKTPEEKAWNLMMRKCFHGTCVVIIISWCIYSRIYRWLYDGRYPEFPVPLPFGFDSYFGEPETSSDDPVELAEALSKAGGGGPVVVDSEWGEEFEI